MSGRPADKEIGAYVILREIGRGGMAVVYEARHGESGRIVALKVLNRGRGQREKSLRRFLREGEAARRLHHPNIVRIHEVGQDGDDCFIAMDFIAGPSLEDMIFELRRGRRDALRHFRPDLANLPDPVVRQEAFQRAILEALGGIALAVEEAHRGGLVHRDIKPGNILLGEPGQLVLTDFGLVQDLGAQTLTLTGDVLGTPLYMAPEQIAGDRAKVGPKSDIYALGATIHETLGLQSPYSATDITALARQIARQEPRDLAELNPSIPASVHVIVQRAMAKRPQDRYQRAGEIAADIHRFLAGQPIDARPPSFGERLRSLGRRHPARTASLGVIILLAVLFVSWSSWRDRDARQRLQKESQRTFEDGVNLLKGEAWTAAWQTAAEIERENPRSELAGVLRRNISKALRQAFLDRLYRGTTHLREACTLKLLAEQLPGYELNQSVWHRELIAAFLAEATITGSDAGEASLDWVFRMLSEEAEEDDGPRLVRYMARVCAEAQDRFDYPRALAVARRASRWGLRGPDFPPRDFLTWETAPWTRLSSLAVHLGRDTLKEALNSLGQDELGELPWPALRRFLKRCLDGADLELARCVLRLVRLGHLPGLAAELCELGDRLPAIQPDLLLFWSTQPDLQAQDTLVRWSEGTTKGAALLRLIAALRAPGAAARNFLEGCMPDADATTLEAIAEVLGPVNYSPGRAELQERMAAMDEDERSAFVLPFVRLGGEPPWKWVEPALHAPPAGQERLVNVLMQAAFPVPPAWAEAHSESREAPLRRLARHALLRQERGRARRVFLDPSLGTAERFAAGQHIQPSRLAEILKEHREQVGTDAVLMAFTLSRGGVNLKKGSPEHVRRVAWLFEQYREHGDELVRSWALAALEPLNVPEFAAVIAKDLAEFDAESSGSLLRDILGQGQKNRALQEVLDAFAAAGMHRELARSSDINRARCRLLGAMGRQKGWISRDLRQDVSRTLLECAARQDLALAVRQEALRALVSFPEGVHLDDLAEASEFDINGILAATAAVLLGELGRDAAGLQLLRQKGRRSGPVHVARAWLLGRLNRPGEALLELERAYLRGWRFDEGAPDVSELASLRSLEAFREIWRRLASG